MGLSLAADSNQCMKAACAVFSHHRHGTDLMRHVLGEMGGILDMSLKSIESINIRDFTKSQFNGHGLRLYEDMNVDLLEDILKKTPGIRAVHLLRQPTKAVASDYAYAKNLRPGQESDAEVELGRKVRDMSTEDGIRATCDFYKEQYLDQPVEVHQYIQDEELENVLEVDFEDFKKNYDKTMQTIFEHFLGSDHPLIDTLVDKARDWDISRHPEAGENGMNDHVTDVSVKEQALQAMKNQYREGDSCMKRLKKSDELEGYDSPF